MKKIQNKIITIILIMILAFLYFYNVNAEELVPTYEIEVKMLNKSQEYQFFVLLPQNYITYAIKKSNLDISYQGAKTLKENEILGIDVQKNNIQENVYQEDGIEYVQILLKPDSEETYYFSVLEDYPNMDIKFRIKSEEEDNIMNIENFKVQDKICKIEYDFTTNTFRNIRKIKGKISWWQIVIVILIILMIWYITRKKE